jgi:signal transduction histidine kinase/CheY-like chemotaxis protein
MTATTATSAPRDAAIDLVCMRLGYDSMVASPTTAVSATVVAILLSREVPWERLAIWVAIAWAISLVRAALALRLRRKPPTDDETRAFFPVYALLMGLAAANWGVLVFITGLSTSPFVIGVVVLVILGMMSAGAQALAGTPSVFRTSVVLSLGPVGAHMLLSGDPVLRGFLVMAVAHVLAMFASLRTNTAAAREMVALRFENEALVGALTEQNTREAAARREAEEANRQKTAFLAAAGHDVRQPLHALGLFVDALQAQALPPEAARIVESMDQAHASLASLHEGLLDVSRLDAGAITAVIRPVRALELTARVALEARPRAEEKGLTLKVVSADLILKTDQELLVRVLRNLVANAITYTPTGRVLLAVRRRGSSALIQVWDTGVGIPEAEHERIFEELYQVGNRARDREQGLGLGLAIVRRLSALLGTEVRARSVPGRGSVFQFTIPLAEAGAVAEVSPAPEVSAGAGPTRGREGLPKGPTQLIPGAIALVVDDEPLARKALAGTLERWGYEVITAASAGEALEHAAGLPRLDLLVTDLWLPDRSGLEMIDDLGRGDLPIVVTTGDTDPSTAAEVEARGLLLLPKPVRAAQLAAALSSSTFAGRDPQ